MTIDGLIDSFNYSYSNSSIDITAYQDYMKDVNGNGANDTLVLNFTASVSADGQFTFIASLIDNGTLHINSTTKIVTSSDNAAQVNFPTEFLTDKKFNYTLEILNVDNNLVFRTNKIETNHYNAYEAGLTLLSLADQNVDNSYLEITVQLNSSKAFTANITVALSYNSSSIAATEEKPISTGVNSYTIKVDNETIKSTHYASNFTINSVVVENKVFNTDRNTSIHNFEDYAKTSYIKAAKDGRVDSDANDLSEFLEINFTVVSKDTGTYTLAYDLYDEFGNFVANISKTQSLEVGNNTIKTLINGSDIYKTKINGPYLVSFAALSVGNDTKDVLLNAHLTNETFYADFERPPLPDLAISLDFHFNETTNVTNLTITLSNNGTAPAFNVFLDVFDNTTYGNNRSLPFMDAGETATYQLNMTDSSNATLYTIIADFDNLVDETNESNNIAQNVEEQVTVVSLAIDSITELYSNSTLKIFEFVTHNDGTTTVENISWQFDTGDNAVINSTQNISSLSAGERAFVYIAYNFSGGGTYMVKANATGLTASSNTLSASASVGDFLITSFTVFNPQNTAAVFSYAVKNNLDQSFPLNWTLNTGESLLTNSSLSHSIAGNETVLGFIGHNYSDYGAYSVSFTARASGSLTDEEALTLMMKTLNVSQISILNQSGRASAFEIVIANSWENSLTGINWSFDTKDDLIVNATMLTALQPAEELFLYIGHNFSATGTFNVNATARDGTLEDSLRAEVVVT